MEEREFRRILKMFPVVRSRDYCADSGGSSSQTSQNKIKDVLNNQANMDRKVKPQETPDEDLFWQKLKSAAEQKVGPAKAEKFCKAFQTVHKKLVYEELSLDSARKFIRAGEN